MDRISPNKICASVVNNYRLTTELINSIITDYRKEGNREKEIKEGVPN